jgi:hypothetical protein
MWIKGGMIDRRKKNKKDIGFPCVWFMNYIIKRQCDKDQYNKILKNERIQNHIFTFETTNIPTPWLLGGMPSVMLCGKEGVPL